MSRNLSERQKQIHELLTQGLKPEEIAARLNISSGAVRSQMQRIRQKFGVSLATEVVYPKAVIRSRQNDR